MSAKYSPILRRIGRQLVARINSLAPAEMLSRIRSSIVAALEQTLQAMLCGDHRLVPIPIRATVAESRRQHRSHD